jgi:Mce-associated membrane protein
MADEAAAPSDKEEDSTSTSEPESADDVATTEVGDDAVDDSADAVADDADDDVPAEDDVADGDVADEDVADEAQPREPMSRVRLAMIAGLILVVAMGGLAGWSGYKFYESRQEQAQRQLFLQVGRQGATNLTSIDWEHSREDVQRVLDSATGPFYDQFQTRAQAFSEVVKQAKSKSVGTVNAAAIESASDDEAIVLVAVTVNSSNAGAPEQQPRNWRMKLTVQKDGDQAKVSNVDFVQ